MKPHLIFDYDGTIHDTLKIYFPALQQAFQWLRDEKGVFVPEVPPEQAAGWLGMNTFDMWNSFLPGLPMDLKQKAAAMAGDAMAAQVQAHQASWYPGMQHVLDILKSRNYHMSILSNCQRSYGRIHWDAFEMERWFDTFYDCETYHHAPKDEIILKISRSLPPPYVVIGDRKSDLDCAQASGSPFIGCLYGFGSAEELSGADALIRSPAELPDALEHCLR